MRAATVDPNYIGLDGTNVPIQKNSGVPKDFLIPFVAG
jgi:hypothetical protein